VFQVHLAFLCGYHGAWGYACSLGCGPLVVGEGLRPPFVQAILCICQSTLDRTIGTSHRQGDGVAQRCDTGRRRALLRRPAVERAGPIAPDQRGRLGCVLVDTGSPDRLRHACFNLRILPNLIFGTHSSKGILPATTRHRLLAAFGRCTFCHERNCRNSVSFS
jgi:hypothetical protein